MTGLSIQRMTIASLKMNDLEKLSEQLQGDITECIKSLVGFLTHPHRERLRDRLHQAVIDRINENTKNN